MRWWRTWHVSGALLHFLEVSQIPVDLSLLQQNNSFLAGLCSLRPRALAAPVLCPRCLFATSPSCLPDSVLRERLGLCRRAMFALPICQGTPCWPSACACRRDKRHRPAAAGLLGGTAGWQCRQARRLPQRRMAQIGLWLRPVPFFLLACGRHCKLHQVWLSMRS